MNQVEQIEQGLESIQEGLQGILQVVQATVQDIKGQEDKTPPPYLWRSPEDKPSPDMERVIVRTKDGCMYFESPINGQLMKNVEAWLPIPPYIKTKYKTTLHI